MTNKFNFDLNRMKDAITAPFHQMPSNLTVEEFIKWMTMIKPIKLFQISINSDDLPVYTIELLAKSKTIAEMQAIHLFNYKYPTNSKIFKVTVKELK
jgi:hypothetical protein